MSCKSLAAHAAAELRDKPVLQRYSYAELTLHRLIPGLKHPVVWKLAGLALRYWERPARFS